jgi:hypothetical protein
LSSLSEGDTTSMFSISEREIEEPKKIEKPQQAKVKDRDKSQKANIKQSNE